MKKAAALADMVLERYDSLAASDFTHLDAYNATKQTPAQFFQVANSTDTMGYDGMVITSSAPAAMSSNGGKLITVMIQWGGGGPDQTFILAKNLSSNVQNTGGATIDVYIKDQNGAGLAGFNVRADHYYDTSYVFPDGTNNVSCANTPLGQTDANGYCQLKNVSDDPALQPMMIKAERPGSDWWVPKSDPRYVLGFYVRGSTDPWKYKVITVSKTGTNQVTFLATSDHSGAGDFSALGSFSGKLYNVSGSTVNTMDVELWPGNYVDNDGQFNYGSDAWLDQGTPFDPNGPPGNYFFNNVLPDSPSVGSHQWIVVEGNADRDTSDNPTGAYDPTQPRDATYNQWTGIGGDGYDNPIVPGPWAYKVSMPDPAIDITKDFTIAQLGDIKVHVQLAPSNTPAPGATVWFRVPAVHQWASGWEGRGYLFPDPTNFYYGYPTVTNSNGDITFYNVSGRPATDPQSTLHFSATVPGSPTCTASGGYISKVSQTVPISDSGNPWRTTSFTLTMNPGLTLTGRVVDLGGRGLNNIQVTTNGAGNAFLISTTTNNGSGQPGYFTLCGLSGDPPWPNVALTLIDLNLADQVFATFKGKVYDANFPSVAQGLVTIVPNATNRYASYIQNGACGADTPVPVISDPSNGTYTACVYGESMSIIPPLTATLVSGTLYSVPDIAFNTAQTQAGVDINPNLKYGGQVGTYFYNPSIVPITKGHTYSGQDLPLAVMAQTIKGTVWDDSLGIPLAGVKFNPCGLCSDPVTNECWVTSDQNGHYCLGDGSGDCANASSQLPQVCISNRSSGSTGGIQFTIQDGLTSPTTGRSYNGQTIINNLYNNNTPMNPNTPYIMDIHLVAKAQGA